MKDQKWRIEVTEHQLRLMAQCIEDCHRFYGWNGGSCPNDNQRKLLAETYYLYREIYHQLNIEAAKNKDMD